MHPTTPAAVCAGVADDLARRLSLTAAARERAVELAASLPERGLPSAVEALDATAVDAAAREAIRSILRAVPRAELAAALRRDEHQHGRGG